MMHTFVCSHQLLVSSLKQFFQMQGTHLSSTRPARTEKQVHKDIAQKLVAEGYGTIVEKVLAQFRSRARMCSTTDKNSFPLGGVRSSKVLTRSSWIFTSRLWEKHKRLDGSLNLEILKNVFGSSSSLVGPGHEQNLFAYKAVLWALPFIFSWSL